MSRPDEVRSLNSGHFQGATIEHGSHAECAAGLGLADRAMAGIGHDWVFGDFILDCAALATATVRFGQWNLLGLEMVVLAFKRPALVYIDHSHCLL